MGMYTELYLAVDFREDASEAFLSDLQAMCADTATAYVPKTKHALFELPVQRWRWMLQGTRVPDFDGVGMPAQLKKSSIGEWQFTCRVALKNYENEIGHFLDWISPYIDAPEAQHLGHTRYEEDRCPTLIYSSRPPDDAPAPIVLQQ